MLAIVHRSKTTNTNLTVNSEAEMINQLFLRNSLWLAHVYHYFIFIVRNVSSVINSYVKWLKGDIITDNICYQIYISMDFLMMQPTVTPLSDWKCVFYVRCSALSCKKLQGRRVLQETSSLLRQKKKIRAENTADTHTHNF